MDKKIFVERETYEKNGKQYFTYFIKGVVRGIEARVQLMPPDFTGYTVLDIVFGNENKAELVVTPYLNDFNYFVTFTYDDTKHDEASFRKKLSMCFNTFQKRKGWRYMGVWERAPKTKRLHFHGLFYIPEGTMPGNMIEKKDFNLNTHKMQLTLQSEYFNSRFGRSDFERIDDNLVKMGNAMAYILKYIDKTHEKIVYSRKLPVYVISDIDEKDVLCGIGVEEKKLLLQDKFMCYDEGEQIGVISQKTKSRLRTSN